MKKLIACLFTFLFIVSCFTLFACEKINGNSCSDSELIYSGEEDYLIETEYLEIMSVCQKHKSDENFKILSNCGYYYEKINNNFDVYLIIPVQISTWDGVNNDVFLVINKKIYQYNLYLSGYYSGAQNEDKILKAVELYLTKNYLKSYTPDQINKGLR